MFWLRLSGWLFVLIFLATAAAMLLGSRLPATETTTATATLPTTPDHLWPLLTDPEAQPRWRPDLTATAPLPDQNSLSCWTEFHAHLAIPVCITHSDPNTNLTLQTTDPRLPVATTRTLTLTPLTPATTRITLTESTTTPQLLVRFRRHLLQHQTPTPQAELTALAHLTSAP